MLVFKNTFQSLMRPDVNQPQRRGGELAVTEKGHQ